MRIAFVSFALVVTACGSQGGLPSATTDAPSSTSSSTTTATTSTTTGASTASTGTTVPGTGLFTSEGFEIPEAPDVPTGPAGAELTADLEVLFGLMESDGIIDADAILASAAHQDPRTAWIYTDILRFTRPGGAQAEAAVSAFQTVTGVAPPLDEFGSQWKGSLDYLIAWDLPALPDYVDYKARLFTLIEEGWAPFFADPEATIDWRLVSWGGVFIDDRPLGVKDGCPRGCIPALDDPAVTDAAGGAWYDDDAIVFGVTINGESRAYPKHQMETHEMINDTIGGRRVGIPYCTLCGSAQAYLTDSVPEGVETPVLRTSGLLSRSNKVMYDLVSRSVFDTFTGEAVTGPLREAGIRLEQVTVVASTWGAWKEANPATTIVAEDGGIGFVYRLDPLGGRDDAGPIFPVGDVDPRLPVQELVVGVELGDGVVVAFAKDAALEALEQGSRVVFGDVTVVADGTGLRVIGADGAELAAHEAFWFAWSQFWPDTELWTG